MPHSKPSYRKFMAGQACYDLALAVYDVTRSWPSDERFGLTSQVRRAAFSSAANTAEGAAKRGSRELRRYVDISLGSLGELEFALHFARDCGVLKAEDWVRIEPLLERAGSLTGALARRLRVTITNQLPSRRSAQPRF
jgi:four helix bundle protein